MDYPRQVESFSSWMRGRKGVGSNWIYPPPDLVVSCAKLLALRGILLACQAWKRSRAARMSAIMLAHLQSKLSFWLLIARVAMSESPSTMIFSKPTRLSFQNSQAGSMGLAFCRVAMSDSPSTLPKLYVSRPGLQYKLYLDSLIRSSKGMHGRCFYVRSQIIQINPLNYFLNYEDVVILSKEHNTNWHGCFYGST